MYDDISGKHLDGSFVLMEIRIYIKRFHLACK